MSRWPLMLVALIAGCGTKPHPVTGRVLLDGAPVASAVVTFVPEQGKGRPAVAYTRDDGTFDLHTLTAGDGAYEGNYVILVMKSPPTDRAARSAAAVNMLPEKYNDVEKQLLRCRVPVSAPLVLELTSK